MKSWLTLFLFIYSAISLAENTTANGAFSLFYLTSSASNVDNEHIAVLDLDVTQQQETGAWHIYVEGTSTSNVNSVSANYADSFADAGGASDANGQGRLQVSILEYAYKYNRSTLTGGLIYPSGFAETADWSNDETSQFISSPFVNISTIDAPDYAMGIAYQFASQSSDLNWVLLLSQAQGLADLNGSYNALLSTFNDLFISTELNWLVSGLDTRTGLWINKAEHQKLAGSGIEANYGANFSIAKTIELHRLLFRFGIANKTVSPVAQTLGLSYQYFGPSFSAGAGVVKHFASSQLANPGKTDTLFAELYLNYEIQQQLFLTGSLQNISDSELGLSNNIEGSTRVVTIRLSKEF